MSNRLKAMVMMIETTLPIVLVPGFMLDGSLWDEMVEQWPDREIHRANLLHGESLRQMAMSIASTAPERFVLVGFSLGGYVARSLVEQFPDRVAGLVLIASSLRADTDSEKEAKMAAVIASSSGQFRGLSARSIAKSLHPKRASDKALVFRIQAMGQQMGHEVFARQSMLERHDISSSTVRCPTLIVAGAQDSLRSLEEAQDLCQQIPGACLEIVNDTGHMIPIEQPRKLADLIARWIDSFC